ncbi:cullin-4A [Trichonephila clavipes]|nr:cullin-4A [Trichonephila clavipes]
MIVPFRNEKVSNHSSIPITIDCNVVAFIVFEEGFHQPIKHTKHNAFFIITIQRIAHPVLWLATQLAVPLGLGSNPGEDMDVCKCILPSRHGGTLNSRRAASPLVRLVEGEERWEAPDQPQGVPQNWGETEINRPVTCMVLKATVNDGRHLALCHDEFRVP